MFILTTTYSAYRHHLYDIDTIEDVFFSLTGDAMEAERIAAIASHMRLGDVYHNRNVYLVCKPEEN